MAQKPADGAPVVPSATSTSHNSYVGFMTASTRALASQVFTFYLRVPVKLFRPTRVDYMALAREINPSYHAKPWSFFTHSSPALLTHAIREHGWEFIPNHVLPPLIANSAVGLVLYTTYLTSLSLLHDSNSRHVEISQAFIAGGIAGAAQSLAAAPVDAIATRFSVTEVLKSSHKSLWGYSAEKLRAIGYSGVFAGYGISLIKESLSYSLYFSAFELVKGPCYRFYVHIRYPDQDSEATRGYDGKYFPSKGPTRAAFPSFVLLAGSLAAIALQSIQYPLGKIQKLHLIRLEAIDMASLPSTPSWQRYFAAYPKTWNQINRLRIKDAGGSWIRWLYGGFVRSTLVSLPSTSIGLVVFEIMRLRYSEDFREFSA